MYTDTIRYILSSESVTEGHPDKVCDLISDSILDAYLAVDAQTRVACETLCKSNTVVIAGEITSSSTVALEPLVNDVIREIGYTDPDEPFHAGGIRLINLLTQQSPEIGSAVSIAGDDPKQQGAGDQGLMYGFACDETENLMPLSIFLAHRLAERLALDRKTGQVDWLRPDGKTQVSVEYERDGAGIRPLHITDVLISTQHAREVDQETVRRYVTTELAPRVLGIWHRDDIRFHVNPSGSFIQGGPSADCGLTGRKIIVDTYGGLARHGGGAFSGKDPSKVDRSGAYYCRYVARKLLEKGLARRAEVQVAYAIGRAEPLSVAVDTFNTGDAQAATDFVRSFDFRPAVIASTFDLRRPIYRRTTNYGHFGKPYLPWELQRPIAELLEAYHQTIFFVDGLEQERLGIRVGQLHPHLDRCLDGLGAREWAYITACNPGSGDGTAEDNRSRQSMLEEVLRDNGYGYFTGEGIGDDKKWSPEPSFLVLRIPREGAVDLGRRFGQVAIVRGSRGDKAQLIRCDMP